MALDVLTFFVLTRFREVARKWTGFLHLFENKSTSYFHESFVKSTLFIQTEEKK